MKLDGRRVSSNVEDRRRLSGGGAAGLGLGGVAIVAILTLATNKVNNLVPVDFGHLTERAMLFVVFTFGEMIVAIAVYFEGGITASGIYFELMTFLIVVGLFQSYELCYDHLIDRELITNGVGYMMIHIFLIFSLSTITAALEFMRESEVDIFPKTVFLTVSLIMYFVFLLLLGIYMKNRTKPNPAFIAKIAVMLAAFAVIMLIFRNNMYWCMACLQFSSVPKKPSLSWKGKH